MNKYPPRPKATLEIVLKIAADVARELGWSADGTEDIAYAYMDCGPDGFRMAKELDFNGWDLSACDIETLDDMHGDVCRAVTELEKVWVKENNIQPPLRIGAVIKEGVITGIYGHQPAYYLVKEHGCTNDNRRLLVKFEDAQEREGEAMSGVKMQRLSNEEF